MTRILTGSALLLLLAIAPWRAQARFARPAVVHARACVGELVEVAQRALDGMVNPVGYGEACPDALHYGSVELDGVPTGFVLARQWRAGRNHQGFYRRAGQ